MDKAILSEPELRYELALLYRFLAYLKLDDLTYTHVSARLAGEDAFLIYPFGLLFEEVTPQNLLKVSFEGCVLEGEEYQYNQTGYAIHASLYQAREDIHAAVHLHTYAGVAVSAMGCGLLPISQFSFHFYEQLSYHDYDSLVLGQDQGQNLAQDLGENFCMFLRNHGTLTCGKTLQEALFYTIYLEKACIVQTQAMGNDPQMIGLSMPSPETCRHARDDMRAFEPDLGRRDWTALERLLTQKGSLNFLDV
ncbi:MAG: class II aldolase/adducin family protein [Alphaproteobacteria bacterium]